MKCPNCGSACPTGVKYCPNCKEPLASARRNAKAPETVENVRPAEKRPLYLRILIGIAIAFCIIAVCVGIYKLVARIQSYQVTRLYTRGEYTPTINTSTMSDGQAGHSIVFYGKDGDQIYLPEMDKSLSICGGVARMSIADSAWFSGDTTDVEGVSVALSPLLITESGQKTQLPIVNFTIDLPQSPLTVVSPATDNLNIVTSIYLLEIQVVPGSTVIVNGEDVTDMVDRSGLLSKNLNVYPIGENIYTIIVRTPNHRETRHEVSIYRENYDIEFELDTSVKNRSNNKTMAVSGKVEPGAWINVDTAYIEDSLSIDMETGKFSFIAKFSTFGENIVRFHATMEGRKDAAISLTVDYVPTIADYSAQAWKMDYEQLRKMYEQWNGQVFKCEGPIIDMVTENDKTYLIMDVGTLGEEKLIALENKTKINAPSLGRSYTAYADVSGRFMYKAQYYPMLVARYMDLTPTS